MNELAEYIQREILAAGGMSQLASKIGLSAKKVRAISSGDTGGLSLTDIATLASGLMLPFARIISMAGYTSDKQGSDIQDRKKEILRAVPMLEHTFDQMDFLTPEDMDAILTYLEALHQVKSSA